MQNVECRNEDKGEKAAVLRLDIVERTYRFSVRVLKMVRKFPRDIAGQIITRQIARSGTGVGANVEEAQCAQSRVEFARKMNIALGEARETLYWLRLASDSDIVDPKRTREIVAECDELVRILTTIVRRTRLGNARMPKSKKEE